MQAMSRDSTEMLGGDWRQFLSDEVFAGPELSNQGEYEAGPVHRRFVAETTDLSELKNLSRPPKVLNLHSFSPQECMLEMSQAHPLVRKDSKEQVRQFDMGAAVLEQIFGCRHAKTQPSVDDAQQIVDIRAHSSCSNHMDDDGDEGDEGAGTPETWAHQTKRHRPAKIMDENTGKVVMSSLVTSSPLQTDVDPGTNSKRRRVSTTFFDNEIPGSRNRRAGVDYSHSVKNEEEHEDEKAEREEVERQVKEALAAGYRGPICAYELCPAPMHSSGTWKTVTNETTAGGQEWSSMIGRTYCHACWTQYRTKGTLARKHRREINVIDTPEEVRKRYRRRLVSREDSEDSS